MATNQPQNTTTELSLFTVLLGCTPKGRNVEQHDVMFGVAGSLSELYDTMKNFWYSAIIAEVGAKISKISSFVDSAAFTGELTKSLTRRDKVHIDAWMKVNYVDGYKVRIVEKDNANNPSDLKLYFINLGGYKENEFEEFHKKMFVVASLPSEALNKVKEHSFFKEYSPESLGKPGAAHLDDRHDITFEADDIINVSEAIDKNYVIELTPSQQPIPNEMVVGYVPLDYGTKTE